jgi:hypothetical protein
MAALETLLDQTAEALLRGDLAALPELTEAIGAATPPHDRISAERLRAKAERNARLLQAAARGVKAARARFADITSGPVLTTYDARGRRESVAPLGAGPTRRV